MCEAVFLLTRRHLAKYKNDALYTRGKTMTMKSKSNKEEEEIYKNASLVFYVQSGNQCKMNDEASATKTEWKC